MFSVLLVLKSIHSNRFPYNKRYRQNGLHSKNDVMFLLFYALGSMYNKEITMETDPEIQGEIREPLASLPTKKSSQQLVLVSISLLITIGIILGVYFLYNQNRITRTKSDTPPSLVPDNWKTYSDTEWGFQISYPLEYHFLSAKENLEGPEHYIVPQEPYEKSGYSSKLLEIADIGTSTIKRYLQVVLLPVVPRDLDTLEKQVKTVVASTTEGLKSRGIGETFTKYTVEGQNLPAIIYDFTNTGWRTIQIYYLRPTEPIFGKPQPNRLFRIDMQPEDDSMLRKIVSSVRKIPIVPSDTALYYSAESNKDSFWCDKISDEFLKTQCHINLRGYPIEERYPVNLDAVLDREGTAKIDGSKILLSSSKTEGVKSGVTWIALSVTPTSTLAWQGISFDATFSNGSVTQSLLTVYWDSQSIGQIDGRFLNTSTENKTFFFSTSTRPDNKTHVVGFRLDSFAPGHASVTISNIVGKSTH